MSTSLENFEMPVKILSRFNTIISNYKESAKTKTKTCQTDCETKKILCAVWISILSSIHFNPSLTDCTEMKDN